MTTRISSALTRITFILLIAVMPVSALASGEIGEHVDDPEGQSG